MTLPGLSDLRSTTTVSIAQAAAVLGASRATGYRAAAEGSIPTIRVGRTLRVPTALLLEMVGIPYESDSTSVPESHEPRHDGGDSGDG